MFRTIITFFLAGIFFMQPAAVKGQEENLKFLGIESGATYHPTESVHYDFIRGNVDVSTFGIGDNNNSLSMDFQKWYVGAKTEFRFKENKIGLLCGVRFSEVNSSLSKSTSYSSNLNFFYLLNKQEGTTTEFLKIKTINQNSTYIGVPVEFKLFLSNIAQIRFYVKVAAEFSYRLKTNTNVMFYNPEMEPFEPEVAGKFDAPADFFLSVYGAGGIQFGNESKFNITVEAIPASFFLNDNVSGLVDPTSGGGFQISVHLPF